MMNSDRRRKLYAEHLNSPYQIVSFIKNQDAIIPVDIQKLSIRIADQVVVRCKQDVHILVKLSCDIIWASAKQKYGTNGTRQQRKTTGGKQETNM